jgi:hypothetical protein
MGMSISPDSWILNLLKNSKERDIKTAEYLDQIAEEAISLAKIWENVCGAIISNGIATVESNPVWMKFIERPEWTIYSKNIPRSRLEIFYDRISSVLGKSSKSEMEFVICKIGGILQKKKLTTEIIEEELKRIKDAKLFDKNNRLKDELSIQESIILVNREAAALYSFSKEYKTKN